MIKRLKIALGFFSLALAALVWGRFALPKSGVSAASATGAGSDWSTPYLLLIVVGGVFFLLGGILALKSWLKVK